MPDYPPAVDRPDYDLLVVIPSCGDPATLVPGVRRLLQHDDGFRVRVVVSLNPDDERKADESVAMIEGAVAAATGGVTVEFTRMPGPAGFAAAVNEGLAHAGRSDGWRWPAYLCILNDDARVAAGWARSCIAALDPTGGVVLPGEGPSPDGRRPFRDTLLALGRAGLSGPCSNLAAGLQGEALPREWVGDGNPDRVAWTLRQARPGEVMVADFLSGFCVFLRREAALDLVDQANSREVSRQPWALLDERFGPGGYEDNDLCARAEVAGWGRVIARDAWVQHAGHQTLDRVAPGARRGLANRVTYYDKWANHPRVTDHHLTALFRVKLETVQDIGYMRQALIRAGDLCDLVVVLLTGNPLDVQGSVDWQALAPSLLPDDRAMLQACGGADEAAVAAAFERWTTGCAGSGRYTRRPRVLVDVWRGAFNERAERNYMIEVAEQARPGGWLLSIDHDEVVEPRVDRALVDRWLAQPDPLVHAYDVAFLTLWDSPRLQRVDRPWGDDGAYTGGMRGFRLWRASASPLRPRRVAAGNELGLHCGNCPDADPVAKRVSSLRFRHLGYVRYADRVRKHERYRRLDPNPDAVATGGGYGHLVREEHMKIDPVVSVCGVGLSMLMHEGETAVDLGRQLEQYHGVVDAAVVVWTGAWDADDPSSGPGADVRDVVSAFGAQLVHKPLADDFAAARNAGLDYLRAWRGSNGVPLGWAWVVDPDEMLADPFGACVSLRRCAECSDAYGFLQRFANHRPADAGEYPTQSEAIRLVRLDPDGVMRYSGRIHEGFDRAMVALRDGGEEPRLRYTPFTIHNHGLGLDDAGLEAKTRFYQRLLLAELADNPRNAGAWCSLGMQYTNDGHVEKAVECFQRAVVSDPGGYLPFRELGLHHLRAARGMFDAVCRLLPAAHPYAQVARQGHEWLSKFAPDQPLVGMARRGASHVPEAADVPLPPFPPLDGEGDGEGDPPGGTGS